MAIETVRISKQGRDQLLTLKRRTGIANWNILCRWAFCVSLSEESPPRDEPVAGEQPVEMTWRTFGGEKADVYLALLKQRCHADGHGLQDETLSHQLRLHLHRGISYLAGDKSLNIGKLIQRASGK